MKIYFTFLIVSIGVVLSNPVAAYESGFSCERIKEKSVRAACLKDQSDKVNARKEEQASAKVREDEQKREQEAAAAKKRATDEFVGKSKQLLVDSLKDPDSARFSNLIIAERSEGKLLCGSINARNSFGGYVGAKKFYVLWAGAAPAAPEVYTDGDIVKRLDARLDQLKPSSSDSIGSQIRAAQESDEAVEQARADQHRADKILAEHCTAVASTITAVEM
jgi:hypothetical protein